MEVVRLHIASVWWEVSIARLLADRSMRESADSTCRKGKEMSKNSGE
jgi:hypothetical protein